MDYETTWTPCCRIYPPDCLILSTKWSHWRQQMTKFQTEFQKPLSSSVWPELFRCVVFYTQLLVHLLQLFFCWSCVFLANPTTWKNSCLCSQQQVLFCCRSHPSIWEPVNFNEKHHSSALTAKATIQIPCWKLFNNRTVCAQCQYIILVCVTIL